MKSTFQGRVAVAIAVLTMLAGLSGCGSDAQLICDEPRRYQQSTLHTGVRSPEGLDNLDTLRAMPLPKANPAPERPAGSPCLDGPTN
jgi:hypothetical protein